MLHMGFPDGAGIKNLLGQYQEAERHGLILNRKIQEHVALQSSVKESPWTEGDYWLQSIGLKRIGSQLK